MGTVHIEPVLNSPSPYIDKLLRDNEGKYDVSVLDFHAEASGEKGAVAYNYDGLISVIYGTHTHVPTADMRILPGGSAYVTDLGMCGPTDSILGTKKETVIERFRSMMPARFTVAEGEIRADGVIFDFDPDRNKNQMPVRIRI